MATKKERRLKKKQKRMGTYIPKKLNERQRQLYRENLALVSEVNRRMKGLKNEGYSGTWASKKLLKRIDTEVLKSWQKGKAKARKDLTATQMMAVNKAMRQFLASKTSKARGIRETRQKTIDTLRRTMSKIDEDEKYTEEELENMLISEEDAEFYYDLFEDSDHDFFAEKIGSSELNVIIGDTIDAKENLDDWLDRLALYTKIEDEDIKKRAINLYNKHIKKEIKNDNK